MTIAARNAIVIAAGLALASPLAAQTPAAGDIGLGKRLYQDKATCGFCHGWSGDGAGADGRRGERETERRRRPDKA